MLNLQNLQARIKKLNDCQVSNFENPNNSFLHFIEKIKIDKFRHINNLEINFTHPVTIISGSNKVGKTNILLILACSHEKFIKLDSTKQTQLREHNWKDVIRFTQHENRNQSYKYEMGG